MSDDNHSTKLGRFLGQLPIGERLKTAISAGDYILDKAVGLVDKDGNKMEPFTLIDEAETSTEKETLIDKVLGGADTLLDRHDFDGLTPEENELVDQITVLALELIVSVGLRKTLNK